MDERDLATVTPYRNGPYLIRGPFRVLDQDGKEIATRRPTIALCRCGKSRMRPLCDGTHRTIGFRAPSGAEAWPSQPEPEVGAPAPHADARVGNGCGDARRGKLDACRDAVEEALRSVPTAPDDRRVQQLQALLRDAAEVLRA